MQTFELQLDNDNDDLFSNAAINRAILIALKVDVPCCLRAVSFGIMCVLHVRMRCS